MQGGNGLNLLYDMWLQANGDWMSTTLMLNLRRTHSQKKLGKTSWWPASKLRERYSAEDAEDLIIRKLAQANCLRCFVRFFVSHAKLMAQGQWRWHPDFPKQPLHRLFRCWDALEEINKNKTNRD